MKTIWLVILSFSFFSAYAMALDDPIGWWPFDGSVEDLSGNDNHLTMDGGARFVLGKHGQAVSFDGVDSNGNTVHSTSDIPLLNPGAGSFTVAAWVKQDPGTPNQNYQFIASKGNRGSGNVGWSLWIQAQANLMARCNASNRSVQRASQQFQGVPVGEWMHAVLVIDWEAAQVRGYLNGSNEGWIPGGGGPPNDSLSGWGDITNTVLLNVGHRDDGQGTFLGAIDDLRIYSAALDEEEIKDVMTGANKEQASKPSPNDGANDVLHDTILSWSPGEYAVAHDVYLGMDWEDVNTASNAAPLGVLVSPGQDADTYDPGVLEFGTTYHWRVDEVNGAPDRTVFKGDVWSFTTEALSYPVVPVTATASSSFSTEMIPAKTIDGSGLDDADRHGTTSMDMWLTQSGDADPWIQYEFAQAQKLHEMWVWNSNQSIESFIGFGVKDTSIELSLDGITWSALEGVTSFAQASGLADYAHNTVVPFGGRMAKYVKIGIAGGWGMMPQYGLSELRFFSIPAYPRYFSPTDGTLLDSLQTTLSWRSARQSASTNVVLDTDPAVVEDSNAVFGTTEDSRYPVTDLDYASTYYWRVVDVNDAGVPMSAAGPVLSFLTPTDGVIDDMEFYKDKEFMEIWSYWIDGYEDAANGSVVGNGSAPETTVVYEGSQSLPMAYDNTTASTSEATRFFDTPLDLSAGHPETFKLQVRGNAPEFFERADGAILIGAAGRDIWGVEDDFRFVYKRLTGDGSIRVRVHSVDAVHPWSKAGPMIRESLAPQSPMAGVILSASNGVQAITRTTIFDSATGQRGGDEQKTVTGPVWLRVDRQGDTFTFAYALDETGIDWVAIDHEQTISMMPEVYIGLAVTSHTSGIGTVGVFSDPTITGVATGTFKAEAIGADEHFSNDPAPMYLRLTDAAGRSRTFDHPDAQATILTAWDAWTIPLSEMSPVNPTQLESITVGVGGSNVTGKVFVDYIRVNRERLETED